MEETMTSMLPKDAAELHAIAQELVGQDAEYIEEFLRDLLAEFAKSRSAACGMAPSQSARRNGRRSGPSRVSDGPVP
jgi:hypothetical protein